MRLTRPLLATLALLLFAASPALAAKPKMPRIPGMKTVKYQAIYQLDSTSTWKRPAHNHLTDCYHHYWTEGDGEETLRLKSKPIKVLFTSYPSGMSMTAGTWDPTEILKSSGHRLSGPWTRKRRDRSWWTGGNCGGAGGEDPPAKRDCGTRLPSWLIHLSFGPDGKVYPQMGYDPSVPEATRRQQGFDNCSAEYAPGSGMTDADWDFQRTALSKKKIFGKEPLIVVGDDFTKTYEAPAGARPYKVTTTITWTLQLRLIGKDGEPVPLPGSKKRKKGKNGKGKGKATGRRRG